MSEDLLYESLTHIFKGHITGIISNGAHYPAGSSSCMSLNESIYNHVPRGNKKTYTYMGGGKTHFDSYRKNSEPDYPTQSENSGVIEPHFPDPLTHTKPQNEEKGGNPRTGNTTATSNHESRAPTAANGGKT